MPEYPSSGEGAAGVAVAGHTANSVPVASGSTSLADLAMAASTILARLAAGNIVAATPAQLKTLLAIAEGDVAGLTADLATLAAAVAAKADAAATAAALALLAPLASPTFTGGATAPSVSASGKTGATAQATVLAGGTASGAPTTGAHIVGELVLDATGAAWYCTVAGTPGTWVQTVGAPPAWTGYTPTWTADSVNPAIGAGVLKGAYYRTGSLLYVRIHFVMAANTTFGTGGWLVGLPAGLTGVADANSRQVGAAWLFDTSASGVYAGSCRLDSGLGTLRVCGGAIGSNAAFNSPFTWATGDELHLEGVFQV